MNQLSPESFEKFKCIGSSCPQSCCVGWNIRIDENTYDKYKNSEDKKIKSITNKYVKRLENTNDFFAEISLKDNSCPFLGADKLCGVQKKYGHNYLSSTCSSYPRKSINFGSKKLKTLDLGCPEAARLVLFDKNPLNLYENGIYKTKLPIRINSKKELNNYKIVGEKIFNLTLSLLDDNKVSTSVALCVTKKLMEEQKNLEYFPGKLDDIYNYFLKIFLENNFLDFDTTSIKINFFGDLYKYCDKKLSEKKNNKNIGISEKFVNELNLAYESLIKKFNSSKKRFENLKEIEKLYYIELNKEKVNFINNYLINEFLGNSSMFYFKVAYIEKRVEIILLVAVIAKFLILGKLSEDKNISQDEITKAFYLAKRNICFFTNFRPNKEYKFRDEIDTILKKIDKNDLFNSLLFLFV